MGDFKVIETQEQLEAVLGERLKREKEQEEKIMAEKARLEELLKSDKELQDRQKQLGTN